MTNTVAQQLESIKKKYNKNISSYLKSKQFEIVAEKALTDFLNRVKRGFMPDLSKIPELSQPYKDLRKQHKSNLGRLAKVNLSNATATGQMLDAMISKVTTSGFSLIIQEKARTKELDGSSPRISNSELASYYAIRRDIFEFSDPELKRIIRNIRSDLIKVITESK